MSRSTQRREPKGQALNQASNAGRRLFVLLLGVLLLAGIYSRVGFLDRSLWLDEAWVANAVQASSLRQAIYYADWLQTSPPLFIAANRLVTTIFGTSNLALRGLPFLAGIVSLLLFAWLALKLLKPPFGMIALLLFIVSPRLILYSQSLKQYSTDVLAALILIAVGYLYLEKSVDRRFYVLLAAFFVLTFLSYQTLLFFPFLIFAAVASSESESSAEAARDARRRSFLRLASAILSGALAAGINYRLFIEPNRSPDLVGFFEEGFYHGWQLSGLLEFYGTRLMTLPEVFFFGGGGLWPLVAGFAVICGFIRLWGRRFNRQGRREFGTAMLLTLPVAGILALNVVGVFPLPGFDHRLMLFVYPSVFLVFALGLQWFAGVACSLLTYRREISQPKTAENVLGVVGFVGAALLAVLFFTSVGLEPYFAEEYEDSERAVKHLAGRVQGSDILYVHASMVEQFKLYNRATPIAAGAVVYGRVGMPCCPRNHYRSPSQESARDIAKEILTVSEKSAGRSLWLLITARSLHSVYTQRDDIQIFQHGLASQGCSAAEEARVSGVYVGRFECRAG